MIRKELKRLSRRELVDIIYQLKNNEQELQKQIHDLQDSIQDKRIRLAEAGSIAEAASSISQVFSAAQKAADLYLFEIACLREETQKDCEKMIEDAKRIVAKVLSDGEHQFSVSRSPLQSEIRKQDMLLEVILTLDEIRKKCLCEDSVYG